jgi:hypothetical protein
MKVTLVVLNEDKINYILIIKMIERKDYYIKVH